MPGFPVVPAMLPDGAGGREYRVAVSLSDYGWVPL
jgi:hypothetical protein